MWNTVLHPAPRHGTSTHSTYRVSASPARFHRRLGTVECGRGHRGCDLKSGDVRGWVERMGRKHERGAHQRLSGGGD